MKKMIDDAKEVFKIEAEAILLLSEQLDENFSAVVEKVLSCKTRVIVCGMGKSGIIGRKISSTLASTGTPSFFMHPGEAFHGDLGMLKKEDILILISYSGETEEVLRIIPFLKENGNMLISMTGNPGSTLARTADHHLNVAVKKEACPLAMAPTSSTTAALVMGDALAVALMKARNFKAEDYARFHPGGSLGRRLLTRVGDAMTTGNLPLVSKTTPMKDVITIMTSGRLGLAVVVDEKGLIIGVITDGDLRRALNKHENIFQYNAEKFMTRGPKTIDKDLLLYEAEKLLNQYAVNALLVADKEKKLLGILLFHNIQHL
ncbi:MAG: KpsF/GutQ family sugar-phosphate isomerase [Candidatus Omnitrophota bacterium]|nr:KpsF/GutQ family sugar-phosphate isomerase [Candidatus Omnitrophota bacterium]